MRAYTIRGPFVLQTYDDVLYDECSDFCEALWEIPEGKRATSRQWNIARDLFFKSIGERPVCPFPLVLAI